MKRKTPCDYCGGKVIIRQHRIIPSGMFKDPQEVYSERCFNCGNLLYGNVKNIGGQK